ncbi:hypothetical protein ALC57_18624 [Trachymyrmex cornetzi]|uniref:C2H2-type domain-containing protein n=1 Tax=Trachymyrmex cornetzi TaxID=471704 RepID=A0A151IRD4_9HYME|nr:hypothetical protein ALC57_18624 [Trachymyrmex cornetzi]
MKCVDSKQAKRRKFSHDWLENEKCKSWIKKVPNDDSLYFCIPCNKTFSCSSGVFKHAESKAHRSNMVNNCSDEVNIIEKEPRERKFCHSDVFFVVQRFGGFDEEILKEEKCDWIIFFTHTFMRLCKFVWGGTQLDTVQLDMSHSQCLRLQSS